MRYRNRRTGFVFETVSVVKSDEWELVPEPAPIKAETTEKKTRARKKAE